MQVPQFVPAVIEAELPEATVRRRSRSPMRQADHFWGIIEIELAGVTVRVGRGADAKTVATVLRALKVDA
jgi:transposase